MRALFRRLACVMALTAAPMAAAPMAAGCSALGLADLPQADCVNGGDGFCNDLGATNPTGDECSTWQCNVATRHCEIMPRDDDDDDAPSMTCAPAGTTPDCDDTDGANFPGNTETCDGRDEDCDGIADDGVITAMVVGTATLTGGAHQTTVTTQPDADEAYVVARTGAMMQRVLVPATGSPDTSALRLTEDGTVLPITANDDVAITGIGMSTYALLAQRATSCRQWSLAPVTSAGASLRAADASLLPECPSTTISTPMVAGRAGAPLLAGWLEVATAPRNCGSAAAAPVVIGTGQFDSRATGNRIGAATLRLGDSVDVGAPAAMSLAAPTGTSAFLVAYPLASGAIEVHRITVNALLQMTDVGVVYTEPAGAMPRQGVGLAAGPTADGTTTVALSFYEGCGGSNAISVRWLSVTSSSVTAAGLTSDIGTGVARNLVQVVYQPRSSEWLVAWRSSIGLTAQRLFEDGALEGEPIDIVSTTPGAYGLQARSEGAHFQATTVTGTNVEVLAFGCGAD